jgi:integrase
MPGEQAISFRDAVEQFLAAYRAKNKSATANETERLIRRHLMFDNAVSDISTADITKRIDRLSATPSEQQHVFVAARHLFRWYKRRRSIPLSPLARVEAPHRPMPRDRVLNGKELVCVDKARDDLYGDIVQSLILTGQRLGKITHLRAEYVDTDAKTISWPASAMKGNRPHTIPYGAKAAETIEPRPGTGLVFVAKGGRRSRFAIFQMPNGSRPHNMKPK